MHEDPDYVEVYLRDDGSVSHAWVHFGGEPQGRFVEVPFRLYAFTEERHHEDA
jgi:hypothetical protein